MRLSPELYLEVFPAPAPHAALLAIRETDRLCKAAGELRQPERAGHTHLLALPYPSGHGPYAIGPKDRAPSVFQ